MSHLDGKVAVITGANSGIGLATAKRFLADGAARVYVTARRQAELDKAVAVLNATDSLRAVGVQGDVTKPADMARLYQQVKADTGHIDVVFANAGYAAPAPLGGLTEEHVDGLLDTDVKGVVWTVQGALPLMGDGGSIILSSSIVGYVLREVSGSAAAPTIAAARGVFQCAIELGLGGDNMTGVVRLFEP